MTYVPVLQYEEQDDNDDDDDKDARSGAPASGPVLASFPSFSFPEDDLADGDTGGTLGPLLRRAKLLSGRPPAGHERTPMQTWENSERSGRENS